MGTFHEAFDLSGVRPASYNPRLLDEEAFDALRASIRELGPIRPIIVTQGGILVAGHQRTRAMRAEGLQRAPAFIVPDLPPGDEIRFNQLHNGSDAEFEGGVVRVPTLPPGWHQVQPRDIRIQPVTSAAGRRNEVLRLLRAYGPWGGVVAGPDGLVLVGSLYAEACSILRIPIMMRVVGTELVPAVLRHFSRPYGRYSYAHLPSQTWYQSYAQMFRLRSKDAGRGKSTLYEQIVIPSLRAGMRVFDFGAGQKDYVRVLGASGVDISGVEFYHRKGGEAQIDVQATQDDITTLCRRLEAGPFDLVLADSVLNSVDSVQAEEDVLACLSALCRPGGLMAFSGLSRHAYEARASTSTRYLDSCRIVHFFDQDGLSAVYSRGGWFYQKFHTREQVQALAARYVGPKARIRFESNGWTCHGPREVDQDPDRVIAAIGREFDLPYPDGSRVGRAADVLQAMIKVGVSELIVTTGGK